MPADRCPPRSQRQESSSFSTGSGAVPSEFSHGNSIALLKTGGTFRELFAAIQQAERSVSEFYIVRADRTGKILPAFLKKLPNEGRVSLYDYMGSFDTPPHISANLKAAAFTALHLTHPLS
jgi:hypothetical protein